MSDLSSEDEDSIWKVPVQKGIYEICSTIERNAEHDAQVAKFEEIVRKWENSEQKVESIQSFGHYKASTDSEEDIEDVFQLHDDLITANGVNTNDENTIMQDMLTKMNNLSTGNDIKQEVYDGLNSIQNESVIKKLISKSKNKHRISNNRQHNKGHNRRNRSLEEASASKNLNETISQNNIEINEQEVVSITNNDEMSSKNKMQDCNTSSSNSSSNQLIHKSNKVRRAENQTGKRREKRKRYKANKLLKKELLQNVETCQLQINESEKSISNEHDLHSSTITNVVDKESVNNNVDVKLLKTQEQLVEKQIIEKNIRNSAPISELKNSSICDGLKNESCNVTNKTEEGITKKQEERYSYNENKLQSIKLTSTKKEELHVEILPCKPVIQFAKVNEKPFEQLQEPESEKNICSEHFPKSINNVVYKQPLQINLHLQFAEKGEPYLEKNSTVEKLICSSDSVDLIEREVQNQVPKTNINDSSGTCSAVFDFIFCNVLKMLHR